jgi:hypothetical protein
MAIGAAETKCTLRLRRGSHASRTEGFWRVSGTRFFIGRLARPPCLVDGSAFGLKGQTAILAVTTTRREWKIWPTSEKANEHLRSVGLDVACFSTRREALSHLARSLAEARDG